VSWVSLPLSSVSACAIQFPRNDSEIHNSSASSATGSDSHPPTQRLDDGTQVGEERDDDIRPDGRSHLRSGIRRTGELTDPLLLLGSSFVRLVCLKRWVAPHAIRSGTGSCVEQHGTRRGTRDDSWRVGPVTSPPWSRVRRRPVSGDREPPQRVVIVQVPTGRDVGGLSGLPLLLLPAVLTRERDGVHRDAFLLMSVRGSTENCDGGRCSHGGGVYRVAVDSS